MERADMHAGGVETALIHAISPELVDGRWWPARLEELAVGQTSVRTAVQHSFDLGKLIRHFESHPANGIVGDIRNFFSVDGASLLERMVNVAREDVQQLRLRTQSTKLGD